MGPHTYLKNFKWAPTPLWTHFKHWLWLLSFEWHEVDYQLWWRYEIVEKVALIEFGVDNCSDNETGSFKVKGKTDIDKPWWESLCVALKRD